VPREILGPGGFEQEWGKLYATLVCTYLRPARVEIDGLVLDKGSMLTIYLSIFVDDEF
jgi:hypothetical protein